MAGQQGLLTLKRRTFPLARSADRMSKRLSDVNVQIKQFRDLHQLDNVSYGLTTGLDWQTPNRISGSLGYMTNRKLPATPPTPSCRGWRAGTSKSMRRFDATVDVGGATRLSFKTSFQDRERSYSAPQYASLELKQSAVKVGAHYRRSASTTLSYDYSAVLATCALRRPFGGAVTKTVLGRVSRFFRVECVHFLPI